MFDLWYSKSVGDTDSSQPREVQVWLTALRSSAPGTQTAALLEQRPVLADSEDDSELFNQANVLVDSLIARQALVSHLAARQQADLDRLSRQYPGLREHLATDVALALGVAETTAGKYLDDAAAIRRLPATFAALDAGRITAFKATTIRLHTEQVSNEVARAVEQRVLPAAGKQTMPELREACTRAVLRLDPHGAEQRHERAKKGRGMSRRHLPEGMAGLWIESAAQDIAVVFEACSALGAAAKVKGDRRTADQRRVDALIDICADVLDSGRWAPATPSTHAAPPQAGGGSNPAAAGAYGEHSKPRGDNDGDDPGQPAAYQADRISTDPAPPTPAGPRPPVFLPERGGRRPHILVTVPAATLSGGNQPGYLAGHGPITAGQARTVAADGDLTRLICDPTTGVLLDYGRTRYRPPDVLRDFVHTRDRTCVTPGCRAPAARTDIDHVRPYQPGRTAGGPTDVDNLASLCRHHHRAKDGGGSRLHHHPGSGKWTWTTSLGRTYTRPVVSLWEPADPTEERVLRKSRAQAKAQDSASPATPEPTADAGTTPPDQNPPPF